MLPDLLPELLPELPSESLPESLPESLLELLLASRCFSKTFCCAIAAFSSWSAFSVPMCEVRPTSYAACLSKLRFTSAARSGG